jgi:hypothetical protein
VGVVKGENPTGLQQTAWKLPNIQAIRVGGRRTGQRMGSVAFLPIFVRDPRVVPGDGCVRTVRAPRRR